jgi:hypothetical protein
VGFALGLSLGTVTGAVIVWFAGAIIDWQRDLGFTFGIATRLLPFGDQVGLLRNLQSSWYVVIPAAGLVGGLAAAAIGGLIGGLIAATYNRSPRHASVVVELPRGMPAVETGPSVTVQGIAGAGAPDGAETMTPVGTTVAAPVVAEVAAPVVAEVAAPVVAEVAAPLVGESAAPIAAATVPAAATAPGSRPVEAPDAAPTVEVRASVVDSPPHGDDREEYRGTGLPESPGHG